MIIDKQNLLSNAQALTATADSTNYIDLGVDRDIGKGEPMALVVSVGVAADSGTGDETYQFQLETDDNTSFSSSTIVADATIAAASLTAGSIHVIGIGLANERYLQGVFTLGGTTPSATISAWVAPMTSVDATTYYASGYTVA